LIDYLVLGIGRVWCYFVPFPLGILSVAHRELIAPWEHPSLLAAALTIILWLLAVSVLTARRSRRFFLSASVAWMALVWATVHIPGAFHSSFLFLAYVIALLADTQCEGEHPWLPSQFARPVLLVLLGMQIPITVQYSVEESLYPFSGAKATAEWLKDTGLASRPLVIEPDSAAPAILAFTGVRSAYFPAGDRRRASGSPARGWRIAGSDLPSAALCRKPPPDGHPAPIHVASWRVLAG
jgi:hypothetical protein